MVSARTRCSSWCLICELYIGTVIYCLHLIRLQKVMIQGSPPHPTQQATDTSNKKFKVVPVHVLLLLASPTREVTLTNVVP